MNTCLPFNDKTLSNFIDIGIFFKNNQYTVIGVTDNWQGVTLGIFDNVLDAYGCCVSYGFEILEYHIDVNAFETRIVKFTLD